LRKLPSLSQPISKGSHYHTQWILLLPLAKPVHFTIRKSAKVRNAWKSTKMFLIFTSTIKQTWLFFPKHLQ